MKSLFSDNCHKYVRHFLSVGAFWDRKIHRIGIHGNGRRRNTGHGGWLVNWKRKAPEHWTRRMAGKLETEGAGTLDTEDGW